MAAKDNYWTAQELWMIGVDTPIGIHCCLGGCSAGRLDLECGCDDNAEVRERTKARLATLERTKARVIADPSQRDWADSSPLDFGMATLRLIDQDLPGKIARMIDEAVKARNYPHFPSPGEE